MAARKSPTPRVIFNDDASNFLYAWDDLGADDLRAYLSRLENTHVDMVAYCVAFGGYVTYYESKVAEPVGGGFGFSDRVKQKRWIHNRERLRREVGDYIGFVFETLGELGLPVLASFRMNDAHMSSDPVGPVAGRFWMNHPQWRLGDAFGYYKSCMDYAVPAVREYLRRLVQEVIQKFPDIDGVELDGMRSPFFFQEGKGEEKSPLMTDLLRQVRSDLDATGKRYLLRVNVPRSPELALETGMDVKAWAEEGLVDGISPACYNTDFQLPIEAWKELLGDRVPVHAYMNCGSAMGIYHSLEEYRGAAVNAYAAGADGMYLFNMPCFDELSNLVPRPVSEPPIPRPKFGAQCWHPDLSDSWQALNELGEPEGLKGKSKRLLFYMQPSPYRHYAPSDAKMDRSAPAPVDLLFRCYEDLAEAKEATLLVKMVGVTVFDEFELLLNGKPIPEGRMQRLHAPGGRDVRIHSIKLEPYSQYVLDLPADMLVCGENRVTVTLAKGDPDLFGQIEVRELEIDVCYDE